MTDDHEELSGAVVTSGVTSEVRDGEETVGHVLLLDYDDGFTFRQVLDDVEDLEGVTAVLESSPGSWHVWNLTVRDLEETALMKLRLRDDDLHAGTGYRAGRWVVRVGEKTHVDAEGAQARYKDAPKLRACWYEETDAAQSEGHLSLLANSYDTAGPAEYALEEDRVGTVGGDLGVSRYMTATDDVKREWNSAPMDIEDDLERGSL